jgi:hypothetical protein
MAKGHTEMTIGQITEDGKIDIAIGRAYAYRDVASLWGEFVAMGAPLVVLCPLVLGTSHVPASSNLVGSIAPLWVYGSTI